MWSVLGVPETRSPLEIATFVSYFLPPLFLHFVMAAMAITPQTQTLRIASWLIVALLVLRAVLQSTVIPVGGSKLPFGLETTILCIVTRTFHWTLTKEPLVRRIRPANSTPSTFFDAFDLVMNFRGHGWDWSHGLHVPPETRPSDRIGFVSNVLLSMAVCTLVCSTSYSVLLSFSPLGLGALVGVSIFDDTLPLLMRYTRSSVITIIGTIVIYTFLQASYNVCTLFGVLLLGQDPAQWPPCFDAPWRATSLADFWGRRWHQWLRCILLIQAQPLALVLGRSGLVLGAFLSSALFHVVLLHMFDPANSHVRQMLIGYGMMGPGILAEQAFRLYTGRKVGGLAGRVWTMGWLVLWGNFIIDGYVRAALYRPSDSVHVVLAPLRRAVERPVIGFDTWLHAR